MGASQGAGWSRGSCVPKSGLVAQGESHIQSGSGIGKATFSKITPPKLSPTTVDYLATGIKFAAVTDAFGHIEDDEATDPKVARELAKQKKIVENLAKDARLLDQLAQRGFKGMQYNRFEYELIKYATGVLKGWMTTGHIFNLTAARNYKLSTQVTATKTLADLPEEVEWLADVTVSKALTIFKETALIGGGWDPTKGASITTYFMGACVFEFPNEYRRVLTTAKKCELGDRELLVATEENPASYERHQGEPDPGSAAVNKTAFDDLLASLKGNEATLTIGSECGYTQAELAELLGYKSDRAVEGIIYRMRQKHLKRRAAEGEAQ